MEITKKYNPGATEDKWYQYWMEKGFFRSVPDDREPYTIVIPPPNVTGVLHMGHMLNNTIQDVLVRRARMQGYNACWVPGTDHASIATEAKVVEKLKEQGIEKIDLTREEFFEHAWKWKEKHGGVILEQLKKLGASCDWERTRFTMEDDLSDAVIDVFIDLHNKGYIYRGVRMINWDPVALTALSDEEVKHEEVNSKLYYIRYRIENSDDEWISIATTRPETILGDTAVCVHPKDKRYKNLVGKKALIPLIDRSIPIISDEYVDKEFGTGALKITPAHDLNDYELGIRHNLESIDILNDNGTLNEHAQLYIGKDRFVVREEIEKQLDEEGYLLKVEDLINKVGFSERTNAVIESKLSTQWFCKTKDLAKPALEKVMDDTIQFYPAKLKNTYRHWMENIKDWCISRQLWWGQRIPAWYCGCEECRDVVLVQKEKPEKCPKCDCADHIRQDEDVLDTWFSSWLWPISVFDGFKDPDNEDINYYYPTNDLVTAPEIMFFWVARMIMAGYEYKGEMPFRNVYYTGIVRDKLRRKMSKSLGNSPDPLELIKKFGADGVRVGMLLCSPAGNDLLFNEQLCEQGRNFCNKIWNSFRLLKLWEVSDDMKQPEVCKSAIRWFDAKLNESIGAIENNYSRFRISDALMNCYKLVWDDFCSWYLEMIKPAYDSPIDSVTYNATIQFFEKLLKLLHPFTPFITEEIWHLIRDRNEKDCIIVAACPASEDFDSKLVDDFNFMMEKVTAIRNFRKERNIPEKETLKLQVKEKVSINKDFDPIIIKLSRLNELTYVKGKVDNAFSFIVRSNEYFLPLTDTIDVPVQAEKLKEELEYTKGFLNSVMKKLNNSRFVKSAPLEVVEKEKSKKEDAETKIKALEEQLTILEN